MDQAFVKSRTFLALLASCLALLLMAVPLSAQEDKVVAKVNGRTITEADVRLADAEIGNDLGNLPPEQRRRVLIEYLIETHLFAEAAEAAKLGNGKTYDERLKYWQRRALRDEFFERNVRDAVTESDAKKLYDAQISAAKPQEEVRARHILVETEDKAKEIFEKIAHGEDFARMAKEHSKDPGSKDDGGDLGYFARGQMVPVFEETAFKLKKGDISQPVQSQFGWHIIKVEDRRQRGAPPFDAIKDRIIASLVHRRAQAVGQSLREKAQLEYVDPAIRAEVEKERQIRPVAPPAKK